MGPVLLTPSAPLVASAPRRPASGFGRRRRRSWLERRRHGGGRVGGAPSQVHRDCERQDRSEPCRGNDAGQAPRLRRAGDLVRLEGLARAGRIRLATDGSARRGLVEDASRLAYAGVWLIASRVGLREDVDPRRLDGERGAVGDCRSGCHRPTEGRAADLAPTTSTGARLHAGRSGRRGSKTTEAGRGRDAPMGKTWAGSCWCCLRMCLSMASAVTIAMNARRITCPAPFLSSRGVRCAARSRACRAVDG
jgi:hypothetical protein